MLMFLDCTTKLVFSTVIWTEVAFFAVQTYSGWPLGLFFAYYSGCFNFFCCFWSALFFYSRADKRRTRVAGRNTSEKDATFTRDTGVCVCLRAMCAHCVWTTVQMVLYHKSSAVTEMGNPARAKWVEKWMAAVPLSEGELDPHLT